MLIGLVAVDVLRLYHKTCQFLTGIKLNYIKKMISSGVLNLKENKLIIMFGINCENHSNF